MSAEVAARLRDRLTALGAVLVDQARDSAFAKETYVLQGLRFVLEADYGSWRVNIGSEAGRLYPASFWLAALRGDTEYPDPPVTEEDVPRLTDALPELLARAEVLAATVTAMGEDYQRALRERLS